MKKIILFLLVFLACNQVAVGMDPRAVQELWRDGDYRDRGDDYQEDFPPHMTLVGAHELLGPGGEIIVHRRTRVRRRRRKKRRVELTGRKRSRRKATGGKSSRGALTGRKRKRAVLQDVEPEQDGTSVSKNVDSSIRCNVLDRSSRERLVQRSKTFVKRNQVGEIVLYTDGNTLVYGACPRFTLKPFGRLHLLTVENCPHITIADIVFLMAHASVGLTQLMINRCSNIEEEAFIDAIAEMIYAGRFQNVRLVKLNGMSLAFKIGPRVKRLRD